MNWVKITDDLKENTVYLTNSGTAMKLGSLWYLCSLDKHIPDCADWGIEVSEVNPSYILEGLKFD